MEEGGNEIESVSRLTVGMWLDDDCLDMAFRGGTFLAGWPERHPDHTKTQNFVAFCFGILYDYRGIPTSGDKTIYCIPAGGAVCCRRCYVLLFVCVGML